ncbi:MAG: sigma-E factor regulatory protein RseB domain-containing protein, partial [Burkholderiales bacterium]
GLPREIFRNNDEVLFFLPERKTVKVEKRLQRKPFPALLPEQLSNLSESYLIKLGGHERIAGFYCQALLLEPRDDLRYGYHLWAETNSGLMLKAIMLDENNDVVEQMTFTQLNIGGPIDEEMLKPKYPAKAAGWRYDRSGQPEPISTDTGWSVKNPLAGFKKIREAKRAW